VLREPQEALGSQVQRVLREPQEALGSQVQRVLREPQEALGSQDQRVLREPQEALGSQDQRVQVRQAQPGSQAQQVPTLWSLGLRVRQVQQERAAVAVQSASLARQDLEVS